MSIKDSAAKVKMLPGKPEVQKIIYLLETTVKAPMNIMNGDPLVGMVFMVFKEAENQVKKNGKGVKFRISKITGMDPKTGCTIVFTWLTTEETLCPFKTNHAYAVFAKKNTFNGKPELRITGYPLELGAHKTPTQQRDGDQDNEVSGSPGAGVSSSSSGVCSIELNVDGSTHTLFKDHQQRVEVLHEHLLLLADGREVYLVTLGNTLTPGKTVLIREGSPTALLQQMWNAHVNFSVSVFFTVKEKPWSSMVFFTIHFNGNEVDGCVLVHFKGGPDIKGIMYQINEHASEELGIAISANTEMYIEEQDAASQPEEFESMDQFTPTSIITFKGPGISAVETAPPPNRNTNTMDVDDGMDEASSDAGNGDGTDDSQVSFDSLTSSDLQRAESDSDETPRSSKRRRR